MSKKKKKKLTTSWEANGMIRAVETALEEKTDEVGGKSVLKVVDNPNHHEIRVLINISSSFFNID